MLKRRRIFEPEAIELISVVINATTNGAMPKNGRP